MTTAGRTALEVAARLPGALLPVALLAAIGLSTRSLFTTGLVVAAAAAALALSGPLGAAAAERWGRRPTLLTGAAAHVVSLVLLVTAVDRFTHRHTVTSDITLFALVMGFAVLAGLTAPPVGAAARGRWRPLRLSPAEGLRRDGLREDAALVLAGLLTALLTWSAAPTAGLLAAAAVTAAAVPVFAMDGTVGALDEEQQCSGRREEDESETPLRTMLPGTDAARRQAVMAGAAHTSVPAQSQRLSTGQLLAVSARALLLGGGAALLWIIVLGSALSVYRGGWSAALSIALCLAAGAAAARHSGGVLGTCPQRPAALGNLSAARRRRLLTTLTVLLLALTALMSTLRGLTPFSGVFSGWFGLMLVTLTAALASAAMGAMLVEVHQQIGQPQFPPTQFTSDQPRSDQFSADQLRQAQFHLAQTQPDGGASEMLLGAAMLAGSVLGFAVGGLALSLLG